MLGLISIELLQISQVAAMTRVSGSMKGTQGGTSSRLGILERGS